MSTIIVNREDYEALREVYLCVTAVRDTVGYRKSQMAYGHLWKAVDAVNDEAPDPLPGYCDKCAHKLRPYKEPVK